MSEYRQTYSTTVAAPVAECFAVLTAFEDYPRWSSPITSCRVLERGPDGLPKRVEFIQALPRNALGKIVRHEL